MSSRAAQYRPLLSSRTVIAASPPGPRIGRSQVGAEAACCLLFSAALAGLIATQSARAMGHNSFHRFLGDAADYSVPRPVHGVLFSLCCYCVITKNREALRQAWNCLYAGGNLVVLDAKPAAGWPGKILTPMAAWLSRTTVLGNPFEKPWEDLRELAGQVDVEEIWAGTYFIFRAMKALEKGERA